ncbi:MAG TPA: GTP cyclohydrolase I FolE [bacterium]|nr:GTP cyclohydrolase I FolE [bacterium]
MPAKRKSRNLRLSPGRTGKRRFDRSKVERGVALILDGIGENPAREGLEATPERVCEFYEELLSGMWEDAAIHLVPIKANRDHDLVIVKNIRFTSMCEHHLLPFMGTVGVAYLPKGGRIVGISKIVRAVDAVARRLQLQERMTAEIADVIAAELKPAGVFVIVEAEHLCMTVRGVKKPGTLIVTTEARGILRQPARQTSVLASLSRQ